MIFSDPYQVSIDTVIAASSMLGHRLEDRTRVREAQDVKLMKYWRDVSSISLPVAAQPTDFVIAPLDVLVSREATGPTFHIIELNGTGIGGVSNMPSEVLASVTASLRDVAATLAAPETTLLLAVSGKECDNSPRLNKLMHEKLIFAQALADGLRAAVGDSQIVTLGGLVTGEQAYRPGTATVVIGYIKEIMQSCEVDDQQRVWLHGRQVVGAVNDRFCLNLLSKHGGKIDLGVFRPINGTFMAGGDKGLAYSLLDEFLVYHPQALFPSRVQHAHAHGRQELIDTVLQWHSCGRRVVIKPHGTGIGHGIEFFLDQQEPLSDIIARIDHSIGLTEAYYGVPGGAFPYTICEFVDSDMISTVGHRFEGHKYELRIVVYREGASLQACPSIAKVASQPYASNHCVRDALINNITHASVSKGADGGDYMLPLCNRETLRMLGLGIDEIAQLCCVSTQYVRFSVECIGRMNQRLEAMRGCAAPVYPATTAAINTHSNTNRLANHLVSRLV
jgi:hypothetical protein